MLDYLESLRKRPEPERKKAVFKISATITLAIALVWGAFMVLRVSQTDFSFDARGIESEAPGLREALSEFVDGVNQAFGESEEDGSPGAVPEGESASQYPALEMLFSTSTPAASEGE